MHPHGIGIGILDKWRIIHYGREQSVSECSSIERRYQMLVENIKDLVFELDGEGNFLYLSPNWGEYFGINPDEYLGKSFIPFVHPEDIPVCVGLFQYVVETGQRGESGEYRVKVADGSWRWNQSTGAPVFDQDGKIVSYVGVARDVTEQKLIKGSLEDRTRAIEASIDGIAILGPDQSYVYLNQSHASIYGYSDATELLGKTWEILYSETEQKRFSEEIMPRFSQQGFWRGEATGLKKDGTVFPQDISLTALGDGGLICVVRDITQLMVVRHSLQEALHEKDNLLREFQHRVKNSFFMIMSLIQLRMDMQAGEEAKVALGEIEKRVKALSDLYSLLYATESFKKVDLGQYCQTVTESLLDLSSTVTLTSSFDAVSVPINFACTIGLILIEILTNALKYAFPERADGTIEVSLRTTPQLLELVVRDDGIGLVDEANSAGVGLHLVRGMVNQCKGHLVIDTNGGTRFTMTFPHPS